MRVAVVTPFYRPEPAWLARCHASVRAQTHACEHLLVSDGAGDLPLPGFVGQFIRLEHNHADAGDTPRACGSISAIGQQFDAIAYLDADNWYEPEHVQAMVALQQSSGAAICVASRRLHALDGELLGDAAEFEGPGFADTNCLFLTRPAFPLVLQWVLMPPRYHAIGDRWVMSQAVRQGLKITFHAKPTVAYRTTLPHHYRHFSRPVPPGVKSQEFIERCDGLRRELLAQAG